MSFGTRLWTTKDKAGRPLALLGEVFWVVNDKTCEVIERRVYGVWCTASTFELRVSNMGCRFEHTEIFVLHKDAVEYARAKLNVRLQKLNHETH